MCTEAQTGHCTFRSSLYVLTFGVFFTLFFWKKAFTLHFMFLEKGLHFVFLKKGLHFVFFKKVLTLCFWKRSSLCIFEKRFSLCVFEKRSSLHVFEKRSSLCFFDKRSSLCFFDKRSSLCVFEKRSSPWVFEKRSSLHVFEKRSSLCVFAKKGLHFMFLCRRIGQWRRLWTALLRHSPSHPSEVISLIEFWPKEPSIVFTVYFQPGCRFLWSTVLFCLEVVLLMFCTSCGRESSAAANYCFHCGLKVP